MTFIMIKGSIHQEDIAIRASKMRTFKYINQTLTELKGDIGNNTIIIGDFNTQVFLMYRTSRQN